MATRKRIKPSIEPMYAVGPVIQVNVTGNLPPQKIYQLYAIIHTDDRNDLGVRAGAGNEIENLVGWSERLIAGFLDGRPDGKGRNTRVKYNPMNSEILEVEFPYPKARRRRQS